MHKGIMVCKGEDLCSMAIWYDIVQVVNKNWGVLRNVLKRTCKHFENCLIGHLFFKNQKKVK